MKTSKQVRLRNKMEKTESLPMLDAVINQITRELNRLRGKINKVKNHTENIQSCLIKEKFEVALDLLKDTLNEISFNDNR